MEDYKEKYELGSIVIATRTFNGATITGEFGGFYLLDKSNPKSIVGVVHTANGSYDVEPNSIESVISEEKKIKKMLIEQMKRWKRCAEENGVEQDIENATAAIAWIEKQGEHKPICQLDNSYARVIFPFKAKVKSNGKIVTIHAGQLSTNAKKWIRYQSDVEDGYMVYKPEDLELVCNIEQKHTDKIEPKFKVGDWITINE